MKPNTGLKWVKTHPKLLGQLLSFRCVDQNVPVTKYEKFVLPSPAIRYLLQAPPPPPQKKCFLVMGLTLVIFPRFSGCKVSENSTLNCVYVVLLLVLFDKNMNML